MVYHNEIYPAKLPLYTLTNGKKTLQFQTMSHIGSKDFYTEVQNNINQAKQHDYVLFFEGVGAGSDENTQAFNQALGIDFSPGLYDNLSKLYGVISQDNNSLLEIVNNKDYNIDLNLDEVMEVYKQKTKNQKKSKLGILGGSEVYDINEEVIKTLSGLSEKELSVVKYFNQAFLNFIIKNDAIRETLVDLIGNQDIFSVILDERNIHLVNEIIKSPEKKIFITYGLMHFSGVLKLLQEQDSSWKIIEIQQYQVISPAS